MRSYPVNENPISSTVSEILWYRQTITDTNKQTSCYFIISIFKTFVDKCIKIKFLVIFVSVDAMTSNLYFILASYEFHFILIHNSPVACNAL